MTLIAILVINAIVFTALGGSLIYIFVQHTKYKSLYGSYSMQKLKKLILSKLRFLVPTEGKSYYKHIQTKLFESGVNLTVEEFSLIRYLFFMTTFIVILNIGATNIAHKAQEVINDNNFGKLVMDQKTQKKSEAEKQSERIVYTIVKDEVDVNKITTENVEMNVAKVKETLDNKGISINPSEATDTIKRAMQKVKKTLEIENEVAIFLLVIMLSSIMFFVPDLYCFLRTIVIEDKKNWEVIVSIYTYSIFSKMPPYKPSIIIDNIIEIADIYKPLFKRVQYGIQNGKAEEVIEEIIKTNKIDNELLELLETIKLTTKSGVEKTVESMKDLAENTVEWQKIKEANKRNRKFIILLPILFIVFILSFTYIMYGMIEIISNFSIDI